MQLRFATGGLTSEEYVKQQIWRTATLERCPLHAQGGCGLKRHTPYERKVPSGLKIARWYCPLGQTTFSLLPDCAAARLPSTLADVERVVEVVEASASIEKAADSLRNDGITLPSAVRWVRRRLDGFRRCLRSVAGLLPDLFAGSVLSLQTLRAHASSSGLDALVYLRASAGELLGRLSAPIGFCPRRGVVAISPPVQQHKVGPDPPASPD